MYTWEKSLREDKLRKNPRNPSFSSSLLDEIYREIDGGGDERHKELKQNKEKNVKKQSSSGNGGGRAVKGSNSLIEKWMEEKVDAKVSTRRGSSLPEFDPKLMQDNDPLFFSSGSSSSDSSFGGFSSSETESLGAVGKTRSSCFTASRPKPVRTSVQTAKLEHCQGEFYLFDDYHNHQTNKTDEGLIRSKARALKIYANLKKVKQPISPGGRLTSFINSLFTNGNPKKNKNLNLNGSCNYDGNVDWKTKSTQASTCSSASSFSRSCLSKNSPNSREKRNNGIKRSVRFFPVSVIVDEDSRPCGHKCIYDEDFEKFGRKTNGDQPKLPAMDQKNYKGIEFLRNYQNQKKNDFVARNVHQENDDYEDDAASDSSSDLFELDHLELLKNDRFCEDLPVYETTDFGLNRAIASGLIR